MHQNYILIVLDRYEDAILPIYEPYSIFLKPEDHEDWQLVNSVTEQIELGEKEVIINKKRKLEESFRKMNVFLSANNENTGYIQMAYFALYYKWKPQKLDQDFKFAYAYADVSDMLNGIDMLEQHSLFQKHITSHSAVVKISQAMYFPKPIDKDDLNEELLQNLYREKSQNFMGSYDKFTLKWLKSALNWNFFYNDEKEYNYSKVILICNDDIIVKKNKLEQINIEAITNEKYRDCIFIYIGGGGFVTLPWQLQQINLRKWTKLLGIPIFQLLYRLAPDNPYPAAINDVAGAYKGILMYYQNILNINPRKIVQCGDSAGGNLILGVCNFCLQYGLRPPDRTIQFYPSTNTNLRRFTPSLQYAFKESLLYAPQIEKCGQFYIPEQFNPIFDRFLSPCKTPSYMLKKFPETFFLVGDEDPLHDDTIEMACVLLKNGAKCTINRYKWMSHGFMSFNNPGSAPIEEVEQTLEFALNKLKECFDS